MKKWKKLLLPAMCVFMLLTPVIEIAEVDGSDGAAAVVENPGAAPSPALLNGIIKIGSKTYYYKDGVMQKNCWSADKKQYFGKNGVAYESPKESGYKKNVVVKKIGKKYYGFVRNGYKVKKGVYADLKGTPYYFDKNGVRVAKKSSQLKKASKYMENGVKLRKLLGNPSKPRSYSSCMNGVIKDMKLTYANIYVSLGKKISGGEIIYGIQPR